MTSYFIARRSDWLVLTRFLAFGPFIERDDAQRYADREQGIVLE